MRQRIKQLAFKVLLIFVFLRQSINLCDRCLTYYPKVHIRNYKHTHVLLHLMHKYQFLVTGIYTHVHMYTYNLVNKSLLNLANVAIKICEIQKN